MGNFFKKIWLSHNICTLWSSKGFFSCMKISTHCTYFMTSLPIVNHIGIVNVEPMWDIDISDTPKRFVHSSRTQIFEFPVNRSDFRHHAMRDTWRLIYNHRQTPYGQDNMCDISMWLHLLDFAYMATSSGHFSGPSVNVSRVSRKPLRI